MTEKERRGDERKKRRNILKHHSWETKWKKTGGKEKRGGNEN